MIVDDFLSDFDAMRRYADTAVFRDYTNPADGVVYPHICTDVPALVKQEIGRFMTRAMGRAPRQSVIFMRASPEGVDAPHQAHSDYLMGDYSLMLYLNRSEHCRGGTALVRHIETGMQTGGDAQRHADIWARDTNVPDAWEVMELAEMRPNRAFIFDAELMHRAQPLHGFGCTPMDARLVLTGFFS